MSDGKVQRRLAGVLAADVVGYTKLMSQDEAGTVAALRTIWNEIFNPGIAERQGRIVKMLGDGALVEFSSVVDAVSCAIAFQRAMQKRNSVADTRVEFRIGVNLCDVLIEGDDIFGDGVNVAVRLEGQAPSGGILISDVVHSQVSGKVGVAFSYSGEIKLKNIDRPLRVWRWDGKDAEASGAAVLEFIRPPVDKPSIAVLPFEVMGGPPDQEFFADGLVEDILTSLSKLSGLSVIARNSSFAYKGRAVDVRQVARELGVRFVLEGSVRKAGDRLRISVQLIDATTGIHAWADRFDRSVHDIFAVQDEITLTLATEMQVQLTEGEQARLRYRTATNVSAWSLWIQGLNHYRGPMSTDWYVRTTRCWEEAVSLDPGSAPLNAMLGFMYFSDARHGWTGGPRDVAIGKAEAFIDRALQIDPDNPDAHRGAAAILLFRQRFDDAVAEVRKAVALGPSLTDVLSFAALVLTCSGRPAEAIGLIEKAFSLSPTHDALFLGVLGNAYRLAGRPAEAIVAFRAYHVRNPGFGLADIIMIQEQAGCIEDARETAAELLKARPGFTVASWLRTQFRVDADQMAADAASLRASGIPEL